MLNKRTHILFDQELWEKLVALAKEQKTTVGQLTRKAIKITYFDKEREIQKKRKEAVEAILRFRETYGKQYAKGINSTLLIRKMRDERYGKKCN